MYHASAQGGGQRTSAWCWPCLSTFSEAVELLRLAGLWTSRDSAASSSSPIGHTGIADTGVTLVGF